MTGDDAGGPERPDVDAARVDASRADRSVPDRKRAALATLPFLGLGVAVVLLALEFAPQPLWAFLIVPPVLFVSALTYLTFRSGFLSER